MGSAFSWLSSPAAGSKLYTVESTSVRLRTKSLDKPNASEDTTFSSFLHSRCPSLFSSFTTPWWLNNGHSQTAYCVFGDFSQIDKVVYDRTLIRLKDGGTLGVDSTPPSHERTIPDDTPIVVVMHGLTGGSHESYVRAILARVVRKDEEGGLGYRGIVINFRGCAGVPITSGQLYSAGHTDDLRQALVYISQRYPKATLLGLGFSLGSNVIIRYLAEEGERSRLRAVCALGCPWDLVANSTRLEENFFLRQIYSKGMGSNLVNVMKRNAPAILKLPDENRITPVLPELFALKSPTLLDVDSRLTRVAGGSSPPFPFPTADAYYRWASSDKCLKDVRVPLLAVNANDDPIVRHLPLDVGDNGYVALIVTTGGGHLGWFEANEKGQVQRWITRPVIEWLLAACEDLEYEPVKASPIEEVDGWTIEIGREHLGCKVIGDVGEVQGVEGEGGLFAGL